MTRHFFFAWSSVTKQVAPVLEPSGEKSRLNCRLVCCETVALPAAAYTIELQLHTVVPPPKFVVRTRAHAVGAGMPVVVDCQSCALLLRMIRRCQRRVETARIFADDTFVTS